MIVNHRRPFEGKAVSIMKESFTKDHTLITKGILVIMLLAHHVFYKDDALPHNIDTIIKDTKVFYDIASYCKICIAGFAFLTAYGMTQKFKKMNSNDPKSYFTVTVKRLLKLELSIAIIYIFAVLYKRFVVVQSLQELYREEGESVAAMLLNMVIDMLGLADYSQTPLINVTWWYLSYAILLITAMPFIYMAYRKFRYLLILAGCLLPYAVLNSEVSFALLLPVVILGTAFSYEDWFAKLQCRHKWQGAVRLMISMFLLYTAYLCYITTNRVFSFTLAAVIPYVAFQFVSRIPGINICLKYLGKHATNIFLVHTFIYRYYYTDFIYSFHYAPYILLVLLGTSLCVSIVIELLKKITGYNWLSARIVEVVDKHLSGIDEESGVKAL